MDLDFCMSRLTAVGWNQSPRCLYGDPGVVYTQAL